MNNDGFKIEKLEQSVIQLNKIKYLSVCQFIKYKLNMLKL